jgi:hypothetical protein
MNELPHREEGTAKRLLVVIVNYKTADLTISCLSSLESEIKRFPSFCVTVVDNASGEGSTLEKAIKSHGWEQWVDLIVSPQNSGFAAGNNIAIRAHLASTNPSDLILLLNSDTEVRAGALRNLVDFMDKNPHAGIAGSGIKNSDGSDWPIAFRFITPASEFVGGLRLGFVDELFPRFVVARQMDQGRPALVDWVSGACIMVRRQIFDSVGLLDEAFFLFFEEVDLCIRARRAGWTCWYVPKSRIMHIGGQSTGLSPVSGDSHSPTSPVKMPRMPDYWFNSRHRYFMKNFGLGGAIRADIGFCLAYGLWRIRRILQRKPDRDPPHMLRDFVRHSLRFYWPRSRKTSREQT